MATATLTGPTAGVESPNRANSAVLARGLVREYRRGVERIRALKGVDITIGEGEFVGIVGHSGAGKTTLLNLAGLMDRPTAGSLAVLGHDVGRSGAGMDRLRRENVGFVFQEFFLIPSLTALENVLLPALWSGADRRQRARELLELVGLGRRVNHRPGELSGGEMQRVAVARALVNSPRLLLADEPTGNLDTKTRDEVLGLLAGLNRDSGLTVVVATHDTGLRSRFARVIRLENGEVAGER
jgi:putative ABC transport system ATP-binding protein